MDFVKLHGDRSAEWYNTNGFANIQFSGYWSSTSNTFATNFASYVNMGNGLVNGYDKTSLYYVWPVRDAK